MCTCAYKKSSTLLVYFRLADTPFLRKRARAHKIASLFQYVHSHLNKCFQKILFLAALFYSPRENASRVHTLVYALRQIQIAISLTTNSCLAAETLISCMLVVSLRRQNYRDIRRIACTCEFNYGRVIKCCIIKRSRNSILLVLFCRYYRRVKGVSGNKSQERDETRENFASRTPATVACIPFVFSANITKRYIAPAASSFFLVCHAAGSLTRGRSGLQSPSSYPRTTRSWNVISSQDFILRGSLVALLLKTFF